MIDIDPSDWQCSPDLTGDDAEDTRLLREMRESALNYIRSFSWSPPITRVCLAFGVGGVLALFLIEFDHPIAGADSQLWVVVGDLPSAYFVTDEAPDPASALGIYCELMEDWVGAVQSSGSLEEVFPVSAEPTRTNAQQLADRIAFIRESFIPTL